MSTQEMSSLEITHELDKLEEILSPSVMEKCFSIVNVPFEYVMAASFVYKCIENTKNKVNNIFFSLLLI